MGRLVNYEPRWINLQGAVEGTRFYMGVSFINPMGERGACPTCGHNRDKRLAVSFWPPIDPDNLIGKWGDEWAQNIKSNFHFHNRVSGETFDTLTISPSIGLDPLWHGSITNGEILPAK